MPALAPRNRTVVLYGKPGCCLCSEAKAEIERARAQIEFDLREIDVSIDPVLNRRYGERIPVVEVGGIEAFQFHVSASDLHDLLDRVRP